MRRRAVLAVAAIGIGAVSLASMLMAPSETTLLQAAVSARDYRTAASHSADAREPGGFALALRALLGSGRTAAALDRVDRQLVADPDNLALLRTRAALLGRLGRDVDQAVLLDRIARRTGRVDDIRTLAALSAARGDAPVERAMLTALATTGRATPGETERLGLLDAAAGDPARALARLTALPRLSPDGAARLLALAERQADPATLLALLARLRAAGHAVPDPAVIVARLTTTRPDAALHIADRIAATDPSALLVERIALLRATGRPADATALLDRAIATPAIRIAPADIVRIAYELNHIPALFAAADRGRITRVPVATALDLARRAVAADRFDLIPRIDRLAAGDWRAADPWLALLLARRTGDTAATLRYAALLPAARVQGVAEAALRASGDRAGLRRLLLTDTSDPVAAAARLTAAGFAADGERLLRTAAQDAGPADPATLRLLYAWGPRPEPSALIWLRTRARTAPDPGTRLAWLTLYANRDRRDRALAVLAADPLADSTPLLLLRLDLADGPTHADQAIAAIDRLLDGRPLARADLRRIAAALPATAGPARRAAVEGRLIAAGLATPRMRLDLAWAAYDSRRIAEARGHVAAYLIAQPDDAAALSLAGEIEQAAGAAAPARAFFARALAATPASPGTAATRAGLLERLGRPRDALALVRTLPESPARRTQEARLLIAIGRPAAATALLADAR